VTEITRTLLARGSDRSAILRALAPLALMGLIFYLSAQPAGPELPGWEVALRKLGHLGGYALLTGLWTWALWGTARRPLLWAVAIAFLYACSDEWHQSFVETRHATPVDVLIDSLGVALAAGVIWIIPRPEGPKTSSSRTQADRRGERIERVPEQGRRPRTPSGTGSQRP
jgi:VanZ family protein